MYGAKCLNARCYNRASDESHWCFDCQDKQRLEDAKARAHLRLHRERLVQEQE
jgi:hypothetical protein